MQPECCSNGQSSEPDQRPGSRRGLLSRLFLARSGLWVLVLPLLAGVISGSLQALLTLQQQPVFDSMAYLERLHRVMTRAVHEGWAAGVAEAVVENTVCLPFLVAVPLSGWVRPSHWVGTAIQAIGLIAWLWVLDRALIRVGIQRVSNRVLVLVSFFCLELVWFSNGGLGDFRMDFSLMLGYGATCLALGLALRGADWRDWVGVGVLASATCLVRGTAPVYLVVAGLPVCLVHVLWATPAGRRRSLAGMAIAVLIVALLCGWFFVLNFGYLKFYYLQWNTDANARRSVVESLVHFDFVFRQIGVFGTALAFCLGGVAWRWGRETAALDGGAQPATVFSAHRSRWQCELLWMSAVPLGLMILGGAGPNPFVSMPATVCLFAAAGLGLGSWMERLSARQRKQIWLVVAVGLVLVLGRGVKKHGWPKERYRQAHWQAIEWMLMDAQSSGAKEARFCGLGTLMVHSESLWSCLLFDRRDAFVQGEWARIGEVRFRPDRRLMLPARIDWERIPGASDAQRCDYLAAGLEGAVDYLVLPDEATAVEIMNSPSPDVVNRHLPAIRSRLVARYRLKKLGDLVSPVNPGRFELFRLEGTTGPGSPAR